MKPKFAIKTLLGLLVAVMLFHLSILLKFIPYEITWGGRLKTDPEMYVFESISMLINLFLFIVLLIKGKYLKEFLSPAIVHFVLWVFLLLFGLNTVGNMFAKTSFEKFFALLTLFASYLIAVILNLIKPKKDSII